MGTTNFSAKEPSLGYYHQIRYSLYLSLCYKDKDNASVTIESLDDIVIDAIDSTDLFQTKLHIETTSNLTDRSSDFWKTIRVWSENIKSGSVDALSTVFTLVTTANIGNDSFINKFKSSLLDEDIEIILSLMLPICDEVGNETNKKGYESFKSLTHDQQFNLIKNIRIADASLSIEETLLALNKELKFSAPVGKLEPFLERLEGWWFRKCILLLCDKITVIYIKELHQKIEDIRESFTKENLPDDFADPIQIDESNLIDYEEMIFVRQLKLIAIKNLTLRNAISDFRRAYDQRSKWLREELTNADEYDRYEKLLFDHWYNIFSLMKDDCDGLDSVEIEKVGRNFYKKYYIETIPPIKIRERFQPSYLTRGSCHMLADKKKIGWHPNYINNL